MLRRIRNKIAINAARSLLKVPHITMTVVVHELAHALEPVITFAFYASKHS